MVFRHNATKFSLLANRKIKFERGEDYFYMRPPTFEEIVLNSDIGFIISFLEQDIDELSKNLNREIKSHYDFLHLAFSLSKEIEYFRDLSKSFIDGITNLIEGFKFKGVFYIDDIFVDRGLFELISEVLFITLDKELNQIKEEDDEFTIMEKKAKMRADRIRASGSKKEGMGVEKMISALLYEYPQYKIEEFLEMNMFTIYFLFSNVGRIANYEISQIAAGNGLIKSKEHKYFTE